MMHFNFWMILAPIFLIAAGVIGFVSPDIKRGENGYFVEDGQDEKFSIVSTFSALVFAILLFVESYDEIIAFLTKKTNADMAAAIFLPLLMAIGVIYGGVMLLEMSFLSNIRENMLQREVERKNTKLDKKQMKRKYAENQDFVRSSRSLLNLSK